MRMILNSMENTYETIGLVCAFFYHLVSPLSHTRLVKQTPDQRCLVPCNQPVGQYKGKFLFIFVHANALSGVLFKLVVSF